MGQANVDRPAAATTALQARNRHAIQLCQDGREQGRGARRLLVDQNHDGVIGFAEADVTKTSDGLPNTRLYLPATTFNRWAITQQLNDGMLAPRFAPSQRAFVLSGFLTNVNPPVPASIPPGSGG